MLDLLVKARENLWRAQERFKCFPQCCVAVNEYWFPMHLDPSKTHLVPFPREPWLGCRLDDELLSQILRREKSWNAMEIGCRILFDRQPNVYMPDVHTLMSFFHV